MTTKRNVTLWSAHRQGSGHSQHCSHYTSFSILQSSLDGQVQATQPYKTAAQEDAGKQHNPEPSRPPVPKLAIVLMCAGTRGDVQPFIALGLQLQVTAVHMTLLLCRSLQTPALFLLNLLFSIT